MIIPFDHNSPRVDRSAFIAQGAKIIGNVEIAPEASIWFDVVIRGDVNSIRIGTRTAILDRCVIHVESPNASTPRGFPTTIGEDVIIGQSTMVHGCTIGDRCSVGLNSIVMNGCVLEDDAMLAPNALLLENRTVPTGQLWAGRPARYFRDVTPADIEENVAKIGEYLRLSKQHASLSESC
jgi:gamma-carbonic anhydrase